MSELQHIDYDQYPQASPYGYRPAEGTAIAFITIFSILGLAHIIQGARYKYWIVFPTLVTGCLGKFVLIHPEVVDGT